MDRETKAYIKESIAQVKNDLKVKLDKSQQNLLKLITKEIAGITKSLNSNKVSPTINVTASKSTVKVAKKRKRRRTKAEILQAASQKGTSNKPNGHATIN